MKILLVNPPRAHEIVGNNPTLIEERRGHNPPLGLLYLAGYLRANTPHQVAVLDAQVEELDYPGLRDRIAAFAPEVVGVTAMTLTLLDVVRTVAEAKAAAPACRVVVGGPHAHLYPRETLDLPGVDYLVLGEGEETLARLVEALDRPERLRTIPGLVFRDGSEVVNTGAPAAIADLDALPQPARDLVPYRKYSSLLSRGEVVTTLFTSRGCPFRCRFCDRPHLGKRFRARSPQNVLAELEECLGQGIREFLFYDDTFTVDRARAAAICDEIVGRGLKICFDVRARVDTVDEALLAKLKAAGCAGVHYGVEAGTDQTLRILRKGITLEQVERTFALTRRAGLPILAYFMIGNPGETAADIRNTFAVARRLRPDYLHLTVLTPFPGTEIYAEALERGIIKRDVWQEFAARPTADFCPPVWEEHLTRAELEALLVEGYRSFYLRPSYVLKRLVKLRSWAEFKKKLAAGLGVWRL